MQAQVIIGGTDKYHDLLTGGGAVREILRAGGIDASLRVGFERFEAKAEVPPVSVVHAMLPRLSAACQSELDQRVRDGMGLVVLHASTVVPDAAEQAKWLEVVGCRFDGHGPFARLRVRIDEPTHPVVAGVGDFEIDDEPYEVVWTGEEPRVLANCVMGDRLLPMVYVKGHGQGRVVYIALGHDMRAWGHPSFRKLVVQATWWVGGEQPAGQ